MDVDINDFFDSCAEILKSVLCDAHIILLNQVQEILLIHLLWQRSGPLRLIHQSNWLIVFVLCPHRFPQLLFCGLVALNSCLVYHEPGVTIF